MHGRHTGKSQGTKERREGEIHTLRALLLLLLFFGMKKKGVYDCVFYHNSIGIVVVVVLSSSLLLFTHVILIITWPRGHRSSSIELCTILIRDAQHHFQCLAVVRLGIQVVLKRI